MVRMFVIPDVCGPAGQRYFLGKHEQKESGKSLSMTIMLTGCRYVFLNLLYFKPLDLKRPHLLFIILILLCCLISCLSFSLCVLILLHPFVLIPFAIFITYCLIFTCNFPSLQFYAHSFLVYCYCTHFFELKFRLRIFILFPFRIFTRADYCLRPLPAFSFYSFTFFYLFIISALTPVSACESILSPDVLDTNRDFTFPRLLQRRTAQRHVAGPTGKPYHSFTSHIFVTTNRAQQGVTREQSVSSSTVAYQQASAVAKPPAAVLSGQHEGKGLAVRKNNHI